MSTRSTSIFKDPNVANHLSLLQEKYIIFSADMAPNNIVFSLEITLQRLLDKGIWY
jgi:hypothetical protein